MNKRYIAQRLFGINFIVWHKLRVFNSFNLIIGFSFTKLI